jgi:copper transport protein
LLLAPAGVWAHAKLVRSEPSSNATLATSPVEVRLEFTEAPEPGLSWIRIATATDTIRLQSLRVDSADRHVIIGTVGEQLPPGAYSIVWRVAGRDGHALHGTIPFSIAQPVAVVADTPQPPPADEKFEVRSVSVIGAIGFVLVRWAAYIAVFLMVGAVVFRQVILPKAADEGDTFAAIASTNAATLGLASSAIVIVTALLKLARESADMPDTSFIAMLGGSTWAMSVTAQIIAGAVAIVAFMRAHRSDSDARSWNVASGAAIVAAIAPAFGGHAISHEHAHLAVPADIVHILAGASWLGTLAVLVLCGITAAVKAPDDVPASQRVARLVNTFSPLALMCGGAVVATGLGSAFLRLDSVDALWTTAYGSALFRKLIFVALLFGTGAWNWRRIRPHLAEDSMLPRLNRSASVELVLGVLVLGFTAFLVALEV